MHIEIAPKTLWPWLGKLGIVTCFILLSFYSVVGGWILLYLWNAITGRLWEGNGRTKLRLVKSFPIHI